MHGQPVHVAAQRHDRPVAVGEDAHHTVPTDPLGDVETVGAQAFRHDAGGALLLAGQFRVAVQVAVERVDAGQDRVHAR